MSRIRSLVDLAYNNDPRIVKFRNDDKEKKQAAKRAKMSVAQAARAEEERVLKEAQLAKEKAELAEQKRIEQIRLEKEQQKRALKKERKLLRDTAKEQNYYSTSDKEKLRNMEGVEKICEMLKFLDLQTFNKELAAKGRDAFIAQLKDTEYKLEEERKALFETKPAQVTPKTNSTIIAVDKNAMWSSENMQLLIKAVNLFPAGTVQRWEVIANYINQHATNLGNKKFMSRDVLNKAKDLQSSDYTKNQLKSQANDNAFASFQKSKKELKIIDVADISVNIDGKPTVPGVATTAQTPPPPAAAAAVKTNSTSESAAKKKASKPKQNGISHNGSSNDLNNIDSIANNKKVIKENGIGPAVHNEIVTNNSETTTLGNHEQSPPPPSVGDLVSQPPPTSAKTWTKDEQALLEQAIKTYPISTVDRWDRIAECIPNRTKKECLRRVKELVDRVNAKRDAQQIVK